MYRRQKQSIFFNVTNKEVNREKFNENEKKRKRNKNRMWKEKEEGREAEEGRV